MQITFPFPPNRKDNFGNFITDERNEVTAKLCQDFAGSGNNSSSRSLVLFGPKGAGKTHLLCAMGEIAKKHGSDSGVLYLDGAQLVEKVSSSETYEELKSKISRFESASFLMIDHLDELSGNSEAQNQVFHLYNAVVQPGGRFAAAVEAAPADWKFADYLSTRLLWGQALLLNPVGDEKRVHVLAKMAEDLGVKLSLNVAQWLVTRLPRDAASQIATIEKIERRSLQLKRKISIPLAKEALGLTDDGDSGEYDGGD